jgi:hypothetical protein
LKATFNAKKLISSSHTSIKISMTLEAWNTHMHHSFNFMSKFKLRVPNQMLYEYMEASAGEQNFFAFFNLPVRC